MHMTSSVGEEHEAVFLLCLAGTKPQKSSKSLASPHLSKVTTLTPPPATLATTASPHSDIYTDRPFASATSSKSKGTFSGDYELILRIDYVKGGRDRITTGNLRIFDSRFDVVQIVSSTSSFSELFRPFLLKHIKSIYDDEKQIYNFWISPSGQTKFYVRSSRLDATGKKEDKVVEVLDM